MTVLVTGANGSLGRLVVQRLAERLPVDQLAVTVRDPAGAADLAEQGIDVRRADFAEPAGLAEAFAGVDRMLLVSVVGPEPVRIELHRAAVAAAKQAGVRHLAYTSVTDADTSPVSVATTHAATERDIRASGIPFTLLRNGMYTEYFVGPALDAVSRGVLASAAGDGKLASAARTDLAEAAAVVLSTDGHDGAVYELTGPTAWTHTELAELVAAKVGTPLPYHQISDAELAAALGGSGLPDFVVEQVVDIQAKLRDGVFAQVHPDLETLLGRRPQSVAEAVAQA